MSTGDLLTGHGDPLAACVAELSRLRAPLGVWGCNGNHEIYTHTQEEAAQLFRGYGMTMLRQQSEQLAWRGAKFNLIGVDYQRQRWFSGEGPPMLRDVEDLARQDMPNILLSHNPNAFPRASELGIELMLAGHTHGGQVQVEILDHRISPARFITPYIAGLYRRPLSGDAASLFRKRNAALYVSRGLGTIGTPLRLGVPPEITLLTLRRA
jgi:predicted MPP superfamily phosphohydrolase